MPGGIAAPLQQFAGDAARMAQKLARGEIGEHTAVGNSQHLDAARGAARKPVLQALKRVGIFPSERLLNGEDAHLPRADTQDGIVPVARHLIRVRAPFQEDLHSRDITQFPWQCGEEAGVHHQFVFVAEGAFDALRDVGQASTGRSLIERDG